MDFSYETIKTWLVEDGSRIFLILITAYISYIALKIATVRFIKVITEKAYRIRDHIAINKRQETLSRAILAAVKLTILIIVLLMILSQIGINIGPLLAGAGIAGIAIGFGAQDFVKNIIAGLFILLEDQYRKGDVVKISGIGGLVEDITLRKTVLRDLDGIEHHIPNGQITIASNMTKNWSRVNLDVPVSYETNLDKAIKVLNNVGKEMAEDPMFKEMIIKPPQVLGVDKFGESEIIIKMLGDTKPLKQWDTTRELRKRIKEAFDKEGIEIPFPHRVIINH